MRWLRLLMALFNARFRSSLSITEESVIAFRVWITDIDVSVMNHAAMMTVMEMGRIDFMVRSGFFKLARRKKWFFPLRSISVQFIRPLKIFQKANLITRVFCIDEKWIYIEQKIIRDGKDIAICVVKSTIKKGKETISPYEIAKELKMSEFPAEGKEVIESYEKGNELVFNRLSSK